MKSYFKSTVIFVLSVFFTIALSSCFNDEKHYFEYDSLNRTENISQPETDPPYTFDDPEDEYSKETCKETERKNTKYILNIRSKKIHKTTCRTGDLILPENREIYVGYIEDLYEKGYTECGNCFK